MHVAASRKRRTAHISVSCDGVNQGALVGKEWAVLLNEKKGRSLPTSAPASPSTGGCHMVFQHSAVPRTTLNSLEFSLYILRALCSLDITHKLRLGLYTVRTCDADGGRRWSWGSCGPTKGCTRGDLPPLSHVGHAHTCTHNLIESGAEKDVAAAAAPYSQCS